MWFSTLGNHFFLRYFLFRIIGRPTYSSPTKSSWWKWSDVSRTSAESTLKKTRWQGKYAAGYKKVQTGLDRSPTPAVLWRDALHTRNQMFQKSSHFCFGMISTDMRSQKQRNPPILLTTSTRPGTGNFLFAQIFEENERESTMLAEIHRSHWNYFWPGSSNVKLHTDQIRIRFLETPCFFITGPIRPFPGLSWNGRKILLQTSLTVKNSTQTELKHYRAKILMSELSVSRIFVKFLTLWKALITVLTRDAIPFIMAYTCLLFHMKSVIQSFQISKLSVVLLTEPTNNKRHQIIGRTRICQREIQMQKQILNIAKGTTDQRVEFILPK